MPRRGKLCISIYCLGGFSGGHSLSPDVAEPRQGFGLFQQCSFEQTAEKFPPHCSSQMSPRHSRCSSPSVLNSRPSY